MSVKLYRLYCDVCNWKLVTDGSDEIAKGLVEIKTSPIPMGIPKLDEETHKIIESSSKKQIRKFKCPKCGRGIRPVKIQDTQDQVDSQKEIKKRIKERNDENWTIGRKESTERFEI